MTPKNPCLSAATGSTLGSPARSKALFLDRDGVINVDKSYVWRIEDFEFVPGIFELCRAAQDVGLIPIVATNQEFGAGSIFSSPLVVAGTVYFGSTD